jgi:hypothetical protein
MKTNMGGVDKIIRLIIALIIGILILTELVSGTLAIVLGIVAVVFVLTSLIGFCGLYAVFGFNTCKKQ